MFYTCSRNTQMHGTRKPHQLSYFIPVLGQKRAKTNVRVPTRTIFYYLCQHKKKKKQKTDAFFFFFFFQNKIRVYERCQVKIPRNKHILLTCKSGNGDKSFSYTCSVPQESSFLDHFYLTGLFIRR